MSRTEAKIKNKSTKKKINKVTTAEQVAKKANKLANRRAKKKSVSLKLVTTKVSKEQRRSKPTDKSNKTSRTTTPSPLKQQQQKQQSIFGAIRKQMGLSISSTKRSPREQRNKVQPTKKSQRVKHGTVYSCRPKQSAPTIMIQHRSNQPLSSVVWWKHIVDTETPLSPLPKTLLKPQRTCRASQLPIILPTDHLPDHMLVLLDQELDAFASYVRLVDDEKAAREHIIQHVTDLAGTLFGNSLQIQCFGSFATPAIATFASDVDLAMWGVVPLATTSSHIRFQEKNNQNMREANQRESRISKWREAFTELDKAQQGKELAESAKQVEESSHTKEDVVSTKSQRRYNSPLGPFVLDRQGAAELGADEEEIVSLLEREENNLFQLDTEGYEDSLEGTKKNPIKVDENNEPIEVTSESDDDSADKLEALLNPNGHVGNRSQEMPSIPCEDDQNDDLEVSFVTNPPSSMMNGPEMDGETRRQVIMSLRSLGRALWKSPVMTKVEVRHRAKVPIVTTDTKLGFEADVAVGGHNGTDTSQFAAAQVKKYRSFSPVVLLLKVLLAQQDLDKPFTGGLGSFKLYVLVSHHLERHLSMGGRDRPSEVLLSFFGRFGNAESTPVNCHQRCFTWLGKDAPDVSCNDGSADLKAVYKADQCVDLFGLAWDLLVTRIERGDTSKSILAGVVNEDRLRKERESRLKQAKLLNEFTTKRQGQTGIPNNNLKQSTPVNGGSTNNVFQRLSSFPRSKPLPETPNEMDASEHDLLAGYGVKRGPRGGLTPKFRPDLAARKFFSELHGRATKNRHSKKKQMREVALKEFALRHI